MNSLYVLGVSSQWPPPWRYKIVRDLSAPGAKARMPRRCSVICTVSKAAPLQVACAKPTTLAVTLMGARAQRKARPVAIAKFAGKGGAAGGPVDLLERLEHSD